MVIVLADGSRSTPLLAVPPSSCTWKVKAAYPAPLALAAGVNTSLPPAMSTAVTKSPALTRTPLLVRPPAPGSVVILTALSALAGLSAASLKPKSALAKVYAVSSDAATVWSIPAGASFTAVTLMVIVLAD